MLASKINKLIEHVLLDLVLIIFCLIYLFNLSLFHNNMVKNLSSGLVIVSRVFIDIKSVIDYPSKITEVHFSWTWKLTFHRLVQVQI